MRVYGLTHDDKKALHKIANERFGKPSLSSLAKHLLINELERNKDTSHLKSAEQRNQRHVIRVSKSISMQLAELAKANGMTLNRYLVMLIHEHLNKEPTLTANEVAAVQHSNYQLYKLGVNLNQIAKALNSQQRTNLSSQLITELQETINKHFTTVGSLIQKSKERY